MTIYDHVSAPAPRFLLRLALISELLDRCPVPRRYAEIGPGRGDLALHLADHWPDAEGLLLDFSAAAAASLKQRIGSRAHLTVHHGDLADGLPGAALDLVVACEVFEHVADDHGAFERIASALAPQGRLLLSVPAFMRKWQQADAAAGHVRRYERAELTDKLTGAGMAIEAFWCYGFPLINLLYPLRQLYYKRPLGADARSATEASGMERGFIARLPVGPMRLLLAPFVWAQRQTLERDWGDGFLVLARRR